MSTLNARANRAYRKYMEGSGADWYGFDHESAAFEEGWETGYKTAVEEATSRVRDLVEMYKMLTEKAPLDTFDRGIRAARLDVIDTLTDLLDGSEVSS